MNYETFKASIVTSIQNYFGETANVSLHPILRNNNVLLDGLTIQDCSVNISPTIYLNRIWICPFSQISSKSVTSSSISLSTMSKTRNC